MSSYSTDFAYLLSVSLIAFCSKKNLFCSIFLVCRQRLSETLVNKVHVWIVVLYLCECEKRNWYIVFNMSELYCILDDSASTSFKSISSLSVLVEQS